MSNENMTRHEAIQRGLFKYYTGKKCRRSHFTYRYTSTGNCAACNNLANRRYSQKIQNGGMPQKTAVVKVTCWIHPADENALREFADALRIARKLSTPT